MVEDSNYISEDLIIRYLNGELADDNKIKQVEEWLAQPEHLQEARGLYQAWELSMLAAPPRKNMDLAFAQLESRILSPKNPKSGFASRWWYAAASITIIGVLAYFFILNDPPEIRELITDQQVEKFKLEDGTLLTLNEQSKLIYTAEKLKFGTKREVVLEGVAYFDVAHQPEKPFVVKTRDAEIEVLSTQFMVKTSPQKPTEVLVTEGKVRVTYPLSNKVITLITKEEVKPLQVDDSIALVIAPSDNNHLYWKTGVMIFEQDSLGRVFQTLSEEFKTDIRAENEAILSCNITATFKKQSLETIIEVIKSTHQLDSYQEGNTIIITGNGCP